MHPWDASPKTRRKTMTEKSPYSEWYHEQWRREAEIQRRREENERREEKGQRPKNPYDDYQWREPDCHG